MEGHLASEDEDCYASALGRWRLTFLSPYAYIFEAYITTAILIFTSMKLPTVWSQDVHYHIPVLLSYIATEPPMVLVRNWLERVQRRAKHQHNNSLLLYIPILAPIINKTLFVEALIMLVCLTALWQTKQTWHKQPEKNSTTTPGYSSHYSVLMYWWPCSAYTYNQYYAIIQSLAFFSRLS